jgi:hypothetical protein
VRYNGDAHTDSAAILYGNEVWARRFQNGIVANPNTVPNLHSSGAMQRDA